MRRVFIFVACGLAGLACSSSQSTPAGADASVAATDASSSSSGGSDASTGPPGSDGGGDGGPALSSLSDDFSGTSLSSAWSVLHPEMVTLTVSGGALNVLAKTQSLWFNASQGPLVYKSVSGNFMVTSHVRSRKASNPTLPPSQTVHLGGLMARNPAGPPENYAFVVVGDDVNDLSVETKTTVNGSSTYTGPSWSSGDAELRLCRVGSQLHMMKRDIGGGAWTEATMFDRPDLPATVQVGAVIYASSATPDLTVAFEELTFAPATTAADCTQ